MELPVLSKTARAIQNKTTMYQYKVKEAPREPLKSTGLRVLKPAKSNTKLSKRSGQRILKGPKTFRGKYLYNLTLIERETCPSECQQWKKCFGNSTPFGIRYKPGIELEEALEADLHFLAQKHPEGFVVRLHILGDFYSVGYVTFWRKMLRANLNLAIYGYTHRRHGTDIGNAVAAMVLDFRDRVSILRSDWQDQGDPLAKALVIPDEASAEPEIVICPEQTGKTESCLTCGICFHGKISVQFLEH